MSQYESALRLFEELDGLEDAFIEEGINQIQFFKERQITWIRN